MIRPNPAADRSEITISLPAILLTCAIATVGLVSSDQVAGASSEGGQTVEKFAEAFRAAYDSRDVTALEKMLYLEGTPDMTQTIQKEALAMPDGTELLSMKVVAARPDDSQPRILNGNTYVPNITVMNRIEIRLGQSGGSYGRFFVVGETPSGDLAIGGIKLAGEASVWKAPADGPRPDTVEAFIEAYKAAFNSGDGATIVKMYYFKDTPDDVADFLLAFAQPWGTITSVNVVDHENNSQTFNGNTYVPNVTDLKRLKCVGDRSSSEFSIGKTPDGYYAISGLERAE